MSNKSHITNLPTEFQCCLSYLLNTSISALDGHIAIFLLQSPPSEIYFLPRDAVFATATCLSVCPSVRVSHPVLRLAEQKQDREIYTAW